MKHYKKVVTKYNVLTGNAKIGSPMLKYPYALDLVYSLPSTQTH